MWRWVLDRAVEQWLCKLNVCVWSFCLFKCFCLLVKYIVLIFACVANVSACVKVFVSLNETMGTCKHWFVLVLMWSSTCVELLRLDKLTLVFFSFEWGQWMEMFVFFYDDYSSVLFIFSDSFLSSSPVSLIQSPQGKCMVLFDCSPALSPSALYFLAALLLCSSASCLFLVPLSCQIRAQ